MICLNLAVSYNMRLNESMHVYISQGSKPVGPIHLFKHYVSVMQGSLDREDIIILADVKVSASELDRLNNSLRDY